MTQWALRTIQMESAKKLRRHLPFPLRNSYSVHYCQLSDCHICNVPLITFSPTNSIKTSIKQNKHAADIPETLKALESLENLVRLFLFIFQYKNLSFFICFCDVMSHAEWPPVLLV